LRVEMKRGGEFDFPRTRYSNLTKRDHDTGTGVESPEFRQVRPM
jgi:hypothetical protein